MAYLLGSVRLVLKFVRYFFMLRQCDVTFYTRVLRNIAYYRRKDLQYVFFILKST